MNLLEMAFKLYIEMAVPPTFPGDQTLELRRAYADGAETVLRFFHRLSKLNLTDQQGQQALDRLINDMGSFVDATDKEIADGCQRN